MLDEDAILNSPVVYSEEEVLAEFHESCEDEAEEPGQHTERVKRAAADLFDMLDRKNRAVQAKKMTAPIVTSQTRKLRPLISR